jgi:hypothetical protein
MGGTGRGVNAAARACGRWWRDPRATGTAVSSARESPVRTCHTEGRVTMPREIASCRGRRVLRTRKHPSPNTETVINSYMNICDYIAEQLTFLDGT